MEIIKKYFPAITEQQQEQFAALKALYEDWNQKINVISRKDIDNLYEHHVLHSLAIAKALNFKPGETCTFTLSGFDSSTQEIPDFNMWFVVCDTLGGETRHVPVGFKKFESGELTVVLPAKNTEGRSSFFILGIDNKETP